MKPQTLVHLGAPSPNTGVLKACVRFQIIWNVLISNSQSAANPYTRIAEAPQNPPRCLNRGLGGGLPITGKIRNFIRTGYGIFRGLYGKFTGRENTGSGNTGSACGNIGFPK